jgi:hypothetical protein
MSGEITSLTRSQTAETPRHATAFHTKYDFFSFKRLHVSSTNLKNIIAIHQKYCKMYGVWNIELKRTVV